MRHEEAVEHLYELHFGALDEATRAGLEGHLAGCVECRDFADTYRTLCAVVSEHPDSFSEHPLPDEIVALAIEDEPLAPEDRDRVEAHVARCPSCARELERVRQVETGVSERLIDGPHAPARQRSPSSVWLAAAAVLLVALIYPAWLGLVRLPQVAREARQLQGWNGAVPVQVIRSPLRQAPGPPRVRIDPRQPFVLLGVELTIPGDIPPDVMLRFEILRADGTPLSSPKLRSDDAHAQIFSSGVVTLLVPAYSLETGDLILRVHREDRPNASALLEVGFEVVASPSQ